MGNVNKRGHEYKQDEIARRQLLPICRHFATNCKRMRINKMLSQDELAEKAGVDRAFISLIERSLRIPTINTLQKIADALQVRPGRMLSKPYLAVPRRQRVRHWPGRA